MDEIRVNALRLLSDAPLERIFRLINSSGTLGAIPACWKEAVTVLLPKEEKDSSRLENRPSISLLNTIAKLGETYLKKDIENEEKGLWSPSQFGFRPKLSVAQESAKLVEAVWRASKPRYSVILNTPGRTEGV